MKRITTVLGALLITVGINAQDKNTEKADRLYNSMEYVDAAKEYEELAARGKGGDYVYRQLAESYYNVFNTKSAAQWYAKVVGSGTADAETHYRYAQMLKAEGKYEEANKQMAQFAKLAPQDDRAVAFKQDPDYLPKLRSQAKLYSEKSLPINSPESDFGPLLTGDNHLYFATARNKARRTAGWDDQPYLDLYESVMNADGTFAEATPVSGDVNTRWHEGPASFSADGNTMYYSSESFLEKEYEKDFANKQRNKNRIKKSQTYLYMATKNGNSWSNVKELPFNSKEYSNRTPSMSKDGKTLYFASDMPGGKGGFDIFKVSVNGDGSFGTPEAVNQVNTEGNEGFPFIGEGERLYFSSDAHKGFGGLDVFYWDVNKGDGVKNLGAPVNTAKDDFAFSMNTAKNIGFVSSNRNGNDDIFQLMPICATEVNTTVKDAVTGKVLADARVAILDDRNNVIETKTTTANGQVSYTVDCGKAYTIQASHQGYEPGSFAVAKTDGKAQEIPANLQPIESIVKENEVVLNEIYFEYDKSNITREGAFELDKLVQVMTKYPALVVMVKAHTDNRGSDAYNMALSDRRARSTVQYILSKGIDKARISGKEAVPMI
ncbi:MAG: cell envelope biogenesis protein OmpA, partial [Sphingobacteriales bacterium]